MIKFEVKTNLRDLEQWLKDLAGKQLPFVVAKTLTDLAGEIKKDQVKDLKSQFTIRNNYIANSFRIKMAKKSDWPACEAQVGSVYPPMELQETSGMKRSKTNVRLGIPLFARKTLSDMIPQKLWVRNLMAHRGYYSFKAKSQRSYLLKWNKTGRKVGRPRGRKKWVAVKQKIKPSHNPNVNVMYQLTDDVKIQARLKLYERAIAIMNARTEAVFRRNLNDVLK